MALLNTEYILNLCKFRCKFMSMQMCVYRMLKISRSDLLYFSGPHQSTVLFFQVISKTLFSIYNFAILKNILLVDTIKLNLLKLKCK